MIRRILIVLGAVAVVAGGVYAVGALLPEGHVASSRVVLAAPSDSVWAIVRNFGAYGTWWDEMEAVEQWPSTTNREMWVYSLRTGVLPVVVVDEDPGRRVVTEIIDEDLPFGGRWTYQIDAVDAGSALTVTENGVIHAPMFRVMARLVVGFHGTQESYLRAVAARLGETVEVERLR